MKVIVPENLESRDVLLTHSISVEEWGKNLPQNNLLGKIGSGFQYLFTSPDAIAVATVLVIATLALLLFKIVLRKKSPKEDKIKLNEDLLKEAEEIEKKRNRVKKKLKL